MRMPRGYSFDRITSGSLAMSVANAGLRHGSTPRTRPFVMPVTAKPRPSAMVQLQTGGADMKKLLLYFALVFAVVAGTATVLTVVTPQSAIADACTSGNC